MPRRACDPGRSRGSGIRGLCSGALDGFKLYTTPVHASVCTISSPGRPKRAGSSPGASACRRALGPRRLVGAAGRGGTCCAGSGRSGRWIRNVGRPARLGRSAAQARHTALTLSTARRWPLARLLPVQARAGTGPFGADVTFLVGSISSRRSIGAPSRSLASPSGGIPVPQPAPQSPACSLLPACARTYAVLTGLPSYSGGRRSEARATRSTTLGLATRAREFFWLLYLIHTHHT